jgi:hypothetical protein
VLEIALVRLARRESGPPLQVLQERVERLERTMSSGGDRPAPAAPRSPAPEDAAPRTRRSVGAIRAERSVAEPTDVREATTPTEPADADEVRPTVGAEDPGAADVDLDDVIVAWAAILTELPPATRAAAQDAQPLRVADGVITLGVAPRSWANARDRLRREADNIRAALRDRLGVTLQFQPVRYDGFEGNEVPAAQAPPERPPTTRPSPTRPPAGDDAPIGEPPPDDPDEAIDLSDLVDAPPDDAPLDSVSKFAASFDATVVEERPRE